MDIGLVYDILLLILSIVLSGYFSALETSFSILGEMKIQKLFSKNDSDIKGRDLWLKNGSRVLNTIFIGDTIFNLFSAVLIIRITNRFFTSYSLLISILLMVFLILIFSEIVPKVMARNGIYTAGSFSVKLLKKLYYIFLPLTLIFDLITKLIISLFKVKKENTTQQIEDELEFLINVGEKEGIIEKEKGEMLSNIIDISDIDVKEVMIPRVDITAVSEDISTEELKKIVRTSEYSRIPVYKNSLDTITGILYVKDLIRLKGTDYSMEDLLKLLRKPLFVPETKKLDLMLKEFQKNHLHMAVVVDEYGGTAGIITMEDILEEIVGDILDEYDIDDEDIKKISDCKYLVNSRMNMTDFCEYFKLSEMEEELDDYETVGGFVFYLAGEVPKVNDSFSWDKFKFTIKSMENRRIEMIEVSVNDENVVCGSEEMSGNAVESTNE